MDQPALIYVDSHVSTFIMFQGLIYHVNNECKFSTIEHSTIAESNSHFIHASLEKGLVSFFLIFLAIS